MLRGAALSLLACAALACGASSESSEDDASASGALADGSGFVILVPTSGAARRACAEELTRTYCSDASARAAADRCTAKIDEKDRFSCNGACVVPFSPAREGACVEGPTYATPDACRTPVADDCSFYRSCLETAHPCGEDGYPLAFGERLCNAFIAKRAIFTPAGQVWLHGVRKCLQDELVPELGRTQSCSDLEDRAFDSHLRCYTSPAHSLCDLGHEDVLALTEILNKDILDPHAIKQVGALVSACLEKK